MHLVIRRYGTLLDVSPDGQSPLPADVVNLLAPRLQYTHKVFQQGSGSYDPSTGRRLTVQFETRYLYSMGGGRLETGAGFHNRICDLLTGAGHSFQFFDVSPPSCRTNCFDTDWGMLRQRIAFRPRQAECVEAIVSAIMAGHGGLVDAAVGFGKTYLFLALALLFPHAKIHIVAKPVDVVARIMRMLTRYIPMVGQVGGGQHNFGRVTVITADSLHLSDGDCDILLCDEAHQLMAPTYSEALGRIYRFSRNFAFTATPKGRFDGADIKLEMFFGSKIFYLPYPEAVALGLTVPIHVRWLPVRLNQNPCTGKTTPTSRKRWGVWRNWERNKIIADDVRTYNDDHQIMILVATSEHAVYLWNQLPQFNLCYGTMGMDELDGYKDSGLLPRNFQLTDAARRENMRLAFEEGTLKKVIATDVWSTGVDFASLPTMYRADARSSEILDGQAPGRVSRTFEGKAYGEVVDCADFFDPNMERDAKRRKFHYAGRGWTQSWPRGERQISV